MPEYDYCITGAGCAGLSLLVRMLREPSFRSKKILLVDRDPKTTNDRTWCFWEKENGFFEEIVYHRWPELWFHNDEHSLLLPTDPYVYKMIRGLDLYQYCLNLIRESPNVTFLQACVERLESDRHATYAVIDGQKVTANYIFNSIPFQKDPSGLHGHSLLQHFKGWMIEGLYPAFDPGKATLMDFRTAQHFGTTFFYVMPFSPTRALVECTLFSDRVLEQGQYDELLIEYISRTLKIKHYRLIEREFGVIPMTTKSFPGKENNIRHIGAAAGATKPSSGYTFSFIQNDTDQIIQSLLKKGLPSGMNTDRRFRIYDRLFLNVLATHKLGGKQVFSSLFTQNTLRDLFAFLDNASTVTQDWKIIRSLPSRPFLRAAIEEGFFHF